MCKWWIVHCYVWLPKGINISVCFGFRQFFINWLSVIFQCIEVTFVIHLSCLNHLQICYWFNAHFTFPSKLGWALLSFSADKFPKPPRTVHSGVGSPCLLYGWPSEPVRASPINTLQYSNIYPLVNIQKTVERCTIFNGKIHYKWAIFNSYVKLPEGTVDIEYPSISCTVDCR